jgi:hypothetical protein
MKLKINEKLKDLYPWKVRWTERAREAAGIIPNYATVIDIGGGMGGLYQELVFPKRYVSIDVSEWNNMTIKADLNSNNWPDLGFKAQFAVSLGVIEYIKSPDSFLANAREYSDRLIISYRRNTNGGIERKNNLEYFEFELILKMSGWDLIFSKKVKTGGMLYYCKKIS